MNGFKFLLVFLFLYTGNSVAVAQMNSSTSKASKCIVSLKELEGNLKIQEIVDSWGGKEKLQGEWNFEGSVMGLKKKVSLEFSYAGKEGFFMGTENGEPLGKIKVCQTNKPNVLKLESATKTILVQKGIEKDTIQVEQVMGILRTGFVSFTKRPNTLEETLKQSVAINPIRIPLRGSQ
jgi:hypothetical protein